MTTRRQFIKKAGLSTAALAIGGLGFPAKSYARIMGSNDRLNVAYIGCGRRVPAYYPPVIYKPNNVELLYICDVMEKQRTRVMEDLKGKIDNKPKLENDLRRVLEDKSVDAVFNATPDHWHTYGTYLALQAGKHVYLEKPVSHNPREAEILIELQKKYNTLFVQTGTQQRSQPEVIEVMNDIHNGIIGEAYLAQTFYINSRGRVVNPKPAAPPEGLDWELFQGPAPRKPYMDDTWDYNWHWYGWDYGTAETGNNATHELDLARWALQVDFPHEVSVNADKYHFPDDGWTMYDTMDASFKFTGNKMIKWDGKSRNGASTYTSEEGRGCWVYGTNGSALINRKGYTVFDRSGKEIKKGVTQGEEEGSTNLGGGGGVSSLNVVNFFDAIRGKAKQNAPIEQGAKSTMLCNLANISYRAGKTLICDPVNGHLKEKGLMKKYWSREYEKGWEL
ncbi:MAG: Gfo/Idh/MocA family oxidoreductase [Bacteroidales bacterium]|nr:Gfo/Idh/MocA family oxidoreductase [Bacteroidales bacterium]MCB9013677.1 Gfo/Idh/MocA family oxidoreductase [Bacteroidales bacterium]